jgi:hypothetical protein
MSKLKMVEIVEETSPKYEVPAAVVGLELSTGTMRCGYWKSEGISMGQVGLAAQVVTVLVTVTVVVTETVEVGAGFDVVH